MNQRAGIDLTIFERCVQRHYMNPNFQAEFQDEEINPIMDALLAILPLVGERIFQDEEEASAEWEVVDLNGTRGKSNQFWAFYN